ncbi:MAG TPA: hypothetical protein VGN72_01890 [Tepidisphaeraceae bacterium]|jgi:hypothetical protein|nr:hypothetical protein [Tepidisphaeraceae bacterium]
MLYRPISVEPLESRTLFSQMVFQVDPAQSIIRLSAEALGEDLEGQGSNGLRASYEGQFTVDLDGDSIEFLGDDDLLDGNVSAGDLANGEVVRARNSTRDYDPGSGPGNYGGQADGPFGIDLGDAAVRDLAFVIDSNAVSIDSAGKFSTGNVDVHVVSGRLDYDIVGQEGSEDLADNSVNNSGGAASVAVVDGLTVLTIPVKISYRYSSVAKLTLSGTIVATSSGDRPYVDANGPDVAGARYDTQFIVGTDATVPAVDAGLTVVDTNSGSLAGGVVTLTNLADGGAESLAVATSGTPITASYDATIGALTLSGNATVAQYQQVLRTLTYANSDANATFSDRVVSIVLNDGQGDGYATTSTIKVWNPNVIELGATANRSIIYTDTDGSLVRMSLSGPGVATVTFAGVESHDVSRARLTAGGAAELKSIDIAGSTSATRLVISGSRGDGFVNVGDVNAPGGLSTLGARNINLTGEVLVGGALRSATFNTMSGASLAAGSIGSVLVYGAVNDTEIRASDAAGARPTVGRVTFRAPATQLNVAAAGAIGNITGNAFNDSSFSALSFGVMTVTGSMVNSTLDAYAPVGRVAALRSLTVRDQMTGTTIDTTGNIGSILVHAMSDSQIYAGRVGSDAFPDTLPDLAGGATITSVAIRTMNRVTPSTFGDSVIAASTLRSIRLGSVVTPNGGEAFGLAADQIGSLTATNEQGQRLSLRRLDDPATIDDTLAATGFTFNDLAIRIV